LIFLKKLILQRCRSTEAGSFFPVVAQYGGKYLVIGGPIDSVEGTWRPAFPVLIEHAHGWYNSEDLHLTADERKKAIVRIVLNDSTTACSLSPTVEGEIGASEPKALPACPG